MDSENILATSAIVVFAIFLESFIYYTVIDAKKPSSAFLLKSSPAVREKAKERKSFYNFSGRKKVY